MINYKTRDQFLLQGFYSSYNVNLTGKLNSHLLQILQLERHLLTEILHLLTSPAIFKCERSKICCLVHVIPQHVSSHLYRCNLITQVLQNYKAKFPSSEQGPLRTSKPSQYPASSWLWKKSHPEKINGNWNFKEMPQVVTNWWSIKGKIHFQSTETFCYLFWFQALL